MSGEQAQGMLSPLQAAAESGRCLYCHDAPCVRGCPAGVDIPAFVKKVHSGNWRGAARVIREANVFGGSCARVCPTEELCEKECSSRLIGRPIPIGALQRLAWERGAGALTAPSPTGRGGRAAVVGAGPAGLAAAWELRSRGWDVTVLEAADKPGGQLEATIPAYRLPPDVVAAEVAAVVAAGVVVRTGVWVGRDLPAAQLLAENDAVIVAAGLGGGRPAEVRGQDRQGIFAAEDFLAAARRGEVSDLGGKRVVVVGGGNTAMDAAVTAAQARAVRVTVVYRRTAREMPAWPREYRGALAAGAEFIWLAQPVAFEGEGADGPVRTVRCVGMRLGAADASGRAAPEPVPGSDFAIEADLVIMALGQGPNREVVEAFGLATDRGGRPVADQSGRASRAKVFIAGDLASGGATVVRAVAEGKKAARAAADSQFARGDEADGR